MVALAAAAWASLLVMDVAGGGLTEHHQHHSMIDAGNRMGGGVFWVALMATAMMAPLVLPSLRRLALTSIWSHRYRAQALFLFGYLATWMASAGAISGAVMAVEGLGGRVPTWAWRLSPPPCGSSPRSNAVPFDAAIARFLSLPTYGEPISTADFSGSAPRSAA